jgi:hypothetical protein
MFNKRACSKEITHLQIKRLGRKPILDQPKNGSKKLPFGAQRPSALPRGVCD